MPGLPGLNSAAAQCETDNKTREKIGHDEPECYTGYFLIDRERRCGY